MICFAVYVAALALQPAAGFDSKVEDYVSHYENVMGTSLEVRLRAIDQDSAAKAEASALGEIDRLSKILNTYDRSSEISRWLATKDVPVQVSPELFELLEASDRWRERSAGAFEPRVQILTELWTKSSKEDKTPSKSQLEDALAVLRKPAWSLDSKTKTATRNSDRPISLNAIAKGFIVDRACAKALSEAPGLKGVLLNAGGDMTIRGELSRTLGVVNPLADSESSKPLVTIEAANQSVATSGRSQRGLRIGKHWYSHIFDPRTGMPAERVAGATVVASNGADADALATILNVLDPKEGLELVESVEGAQCLIVAADGKVSKSKGWPKLEKPIVKLASFTSKVDEPESSKSARPAQKADAKTKDSTVSKGAKKDETEQSFEWLVTFTINQPSGDARRYRRPYVAIWVEDNDGFPVKTLVLWVQTRNPGPRWHPDLKRWYKSDQARKLVEDADLISTIARPTRPPGQYEVVWDGADDNGKPVEPGEYTLFIETAREHGTYQSIRSQIKLTEKTAKQELKGNVEIKSASVERRKKGSGK